MSVIIRLQNLPWSANALDIRQYFHGLSIPEGGVHIVGGELGDAFIAFSTDEDARQAFMRNNGKIKEIQISLMLSSRTEMQRVIEQARAKSYVAFMGPTQSTAASVAPAQVPPMPSVVPPIVPAAVPQIKQEDFKDKIDKKDNRRRSRSKSKERERRDRSRERKDRRRDRSRSRSRDRKSRRRERSRSRNRSRSRDRERRRRGEEVKIKKPEDRVPNKSFERDNKPQTSGRWGSPSESPSFPQLPGLTTGLNINLEQAKRALANMQQQHQQPPPNGYPGNNFGRDRDNSGSRMNRGREWQGNPNESNFQMSRNNDHFDNSYDKFYPNRFHGNFRNNRHEEPDCCIVLEPFYSSYSDLRKFFSGLYISSRGIKFINSMTGRRTGVTYVQFGDKRSKDEAMTMHGMVLNGMEINITHLDDQEFDEAVDRFVPSRNHDDDTNSGDGGRFNKFKYRNIQKYFNEEETTHSKPTESCCLIVEDLPTYCKEQDILHMFALHPLVALILKSKKKGGPVAYAKFSSDEVAKKALEDQSQHVIAGKPVTVRLCSNEEFEEVNKEHDVNLNGPSKVDVINTDCLSVSRLPQKTNDKDIADFFSDIGVIPEKIHLMSNNFGFTGQAYCEFSTIEEAARAAKKHDSSLGNAVVSVVPIKRDEMHAILGSTVPAPPDQISNSGGSSGKSPKSESFSPPSSGATLNFAPPERPFFNRHYDNGPPMRGRGSRFGPRGGGPRMRFQAPQSDGEETQPGCTVFMKNVPYKAGTNEILEFFEGFSHTGNVSRRYNPNNTPSDEAKVVFTSPEEASKAVEDRQKAKIWDRQIFLHQE